MQNALESGRISVSPNVCMSRFSSYIVPTYQALLVSKHNISRNYRNSSSKNETISCDKQKSNGNLLGRPNQNFTKTENNRLAMVMWHTERQFYQRVEITVSLNIIDINLEEEYKEQQEKYRSLPTYNTYTNHTRLMQSLSQLERWVQYRRVYRKQKAALISTMKIYKTVMRM